MECYSQSDIGKVREGNEDCIAWEPDLETAVLADGMGGLSAGALASAQAVSCVIDHLNRHEEKGTDTIRAAMTAANKRVLTLSEAEDDIIGMGTTLVVWTRLTPTQCIIGNVGDSRAYLWRDSMLTQLTKDHSVVQQLIDQGLLTTAEARVAPNRNVITRAIGIDTMVDCDVDTYDMQPGDWFVLFSDGVTDMLTDEELAELMRGADNPAELPGTVVTAANRRGGVDNISVVLVTV